MKTKLRGVAGRKERKEKSDVLTRPVHPEFKFVSFRDCSVNAPIISSNLSRRRNFIGEPCRGEYRDNGKSDCLMKFCQRVAVPPRSYRLVRQRTVSYLPSHLYCRSFRRPVVENFSCLESSLRGNSIYELPFSRARIGDGFLFNGNSRTRARRRG